MNRDNIKLSQLRSLVAVARCGNFGEAGLQLGVSQSAVSHAIASLEEELGVMLFVRGRRGAQLTPVGERMLHHAQQMLQLLDAMEKEASLSKGLQGGSVRIASIRSFATHRLPEIILAFREMYPAIAISLAEHRGDDDIEQSIRAGRADLGITCLPAAPDFEAWDLMQDEYVALFPPDVQVPDPITWDDLSRYPVILPLESDYCGVLIANHLTQVNQKISAAYRITEDSTMVGMVMGGLGATIMARLAAEPLPSEIQIRHLPVPLIRTIRVEMLADALHPPAVFAFLEKLKMAIQAEPAPILKPPAQTSASLEMSLPG